jgi:hypothetical protein
MTRKLLLLGLLFLYVPQTSFAYIDPGTGAYVVQSIAALIGAAVFYVTHPVEIIRKLKARLQRKRQP